MTMMKNVLLMTVVVLGVLAACGSKNKNDANEGGATIDTQATTGDPTDRSGEMVSPETMDEVTQLLNRKQIIISRCLASAVETGEAPKGARGKIALAISIAPSGKVLKVDVIKSSIPGDSVGECVKQKVQDITFPEMPKQYDTSHTYAMEAN
jgi:hypothetical protein